MHRARSSVASRSSSCKSLQPIESLEGRRLLAVAVNSGVLTITGTGSADTYVVASSGANITVVENGGAPQSFTASGVNSILANLGVGSDSISIADTVIKNAVLNGENGNDSIKGGGGNDILDGGLGIDLLDGGTGSDTVSYEQRTTEKITASLQVHYTPNDSSPPDTVITGQGGAPNETDLYLNVEALAGGGGKDTLSIGADNWSDVHDLFPAPLTMRLYGNGSNDVLTVGGSYGITGANGFPNYIVDGGDGNDELTARDVSRFATLVGGNGDDTFFAGDDDRVVIDAGDGLDTYQFSPVLLTTYTMPAGLEKLILNGGGSIVGNELDNTIELTSSFASIDGAGGNDTITIHNGGNGAINGGDGNDTIVLESVSGPVNNIIRGDAGDDVISVNQNGDAESIGSGTADIDGGDGDDHITIVGGTDYVRGGAGNDTIYAGTGDDRLYGDAGDDRLNGDGGKDSLSGGDGDDRLYGASGSDRLFGDAGVDRLYGGSKNDYLDGGAGADYIKGDDDTDTANLDKKDRRYESIEIFV